MLSLILPPIILLVYSLNYFVLGLIYLVSHVQLGHLQTISLRLRQKGENMSEVNSFNQELLDCSALIINYDKRIKCRHRYKSVPLFDFQNDETVFIGVCRKCGQTEQ